MELLQRVLDPLRRNRLCDHHRTPVQRRKVGRHPAKVDQVELAQAHPEIEEQRSLGPGHGARALEPGVGQRAAGDLEDQAVTVDPGPAARLLDPDAGIADPHAEGVDLHAERLVVRRADHQPGQPERQAVEAPHLLEALGPCDDRLAGEGPLRGEDGVAEARRHPGRRIPGEAKRERAAVELEVLDLDQRRGAAAGALAEVQHFLVVHPARPVADQLDHRVLRDDLREDEPAREQVGQPVTEIEPRNRGHAPPGAVGEDHVPQREGGQEIPRNLADVEVAAEHPVGKGGDRASQEMAARGRDAQCQEHAHDERHRAEDRHEHEVGDAPAHQNGCPMAKCTTNRSGFPPGT